MSGIVWTVFWTMNQSLSLSMLCTELKIRSGSLRLAQALRLFVLIYFRTMSKAMSPMKKGIGRSGAQPACGQIQLSD